MAIFEYLSKHSNSLIQDVDSNIVEQFNNVICKYIGGKRVNFTQKCPLIIIYTNFTIERVRK